MPIWNFIKVTENGGGLLVILALLGFAGAICRKLFGFFGKSNTSTPTGFAGQVIDPNKSGQPVLSLTLPQFEERIVKEITEAQANLKTAHDAEKTQLQQKIEELRKRAAHPEQALKEAKTTIAKLEDTLTREGNDIGEARMTKAREALERGDFTIADDIFAEIEAHEQLAVERTARAAFARGEIAEQEIRWADAAKHYTRATELNATSENLAKADMFAWRAGLYDEAITFGKKRIKLTIIEHGAQSRQHATALNDQASNFRATGKYNLAEPLYLQAIEIGKQTLGENHPDYAISLNNLAGLYKATGKYDLAEPLYKQATQIDKQTLGENHPDYATDLNNLAELYRATDKYDLAEPLYIQAISILDSNSNYGKLSPLLAK